uniref:MARVEL domain-containing protein n=1 Tax=Timspurckia oligopyrenoides TaxID=708627 RepID=A0A7S0ZEG6_9RHOD|mmetsp:Transcript_2136/g.3767  ORF Transcript_2136/g.3767 Transcript_2136/m.3767 type:complete len:181 (+) Transcript_2136:77-619(+)
MDNARIVDGKVEDQRERTGPYAIKLMVQVTMWIASIIVFGSTSQANGNGCSTQCAYAITTGLLSFIFLSFLLIFNFLAEINRLSRQVWFTYQFEAFCMYLLILWWIPGVANIASVRSATPGNGEVFAFVAFFGSIYGSFKAYHTYVEDNYRRAIEEREKELKALELEMPTSQIEYAVERN